MAPRTGSRRTGRSRMLRRHPEGRPLASRAARSALSSSSHFPARLYSNDMKPVALPPGRARLSTKPAPTGSMTNGNTIGTVRVACSNGPTAEAPWARMTSARAHQFRRVSAKFGVHWSWPSGCRSARYGRWSSPTAPAPAGTPRRGPDIPNRSAAAGRSMPMRRIRSGCARTASGHVAAAPPKRLMNSRRRIFPHLTSNTSLPRKCRPSLTRCASAACSSL